MFAEMTSKVGVAPKISRALTRAPFFYSLSTPLGPTVNPGSAPVVALEKLRHDKQSCEGGSRHGVT